ncbi:hypothetical protein K488DRAFT_84037 [Vararia minispora EC-137]|uniref:Uncharacterized protein n=1 Tax=Vararia minispora EC-137 TaxID=1314806 RepID=A0ACB8QRB2_9AGAM|nr:hypothetical protein K488DRAFT_84037 [Vararia minispora EC-137]
MNQYLWGNISADMDYEMEDPEEEIPIPANMNSEVLLMLFRCLRDRSLQDSTLGLLIVASHVCRRWRNVALGSPELWTTIPLKAGLRWAEVALERSKPEPIIIHIEATRSAPGPKQETVARVIRDLDRARKFSLNADGWPSPTLLDETILQPLRGLSAPLLEELSLVFRDAYPDAFGLLGAQPPTKLKTLTMHNAWFSGPLFTAPAFTGENLWSIRLTGDSPRATTASATQAKKNGIQAATQLSNRKGIPFPLPNITLHSLTRLEARAKFPSLRALHECLERLVALEELHLSHFAAVEEQKPPGEWSTGLGTHFLSLPGLQRLSLTGRGDYVADLFVSLRLHVSTKLSFICHLPIPRHDAFLQSMQRAVLSHYAQAPGCFRQVSCGENVRILYFSATDYDDAFKFYVELIDSASKASSLVREHHDFLHILLPSSPFRGLQTLYFNDVRVLEDMPPWRDSCRSLDQVSLVHIQARATYGLVDALNDRNLFPVLRSLSIKGDVDAQVLEPLVQSDRQPPVEIRKR